MRWEDERYVRLYTRDTVEWEMLCWQARALMPQILRKVDRAGLLELGKHGARGLAKSVKLPLDVVQFGLDGTDEGPGLLPSGSVELRGTLLVIPNFIAAQETASSDAQRKRDQRERAMAHARLQEMSGQQQSSHASAPPVTDGHSVPSDPFRAEPSKQDTPAAPDRESSSQLPLVSAPPYVPDIESVYRRYPRKEGRKKGFAALSRQLTTPDKFAAFERAVANYTAHLTAAGTAPQYMKHFATFSGCWEDYVNPLPLPDRPGNGPSRTTLTTREQRSYSTPVEEVLRDYENIDVSPPTAEWREQMERLERRAAIAGDA